MTVAAKPIVWMPTRLHPVAIELASELFDVITPADPRAPIWPTLAVASILRTGSISEEEIRESNGRLKIITRNGVGVDGIPLAVCAELGVRVTNLPGSNKMAVSELALGMACSLVRRITELDRRLRRGELLPNIDWMANTLDQKTVGLVGMGEIARETARRFVGAFESPILVYSPTTPLDRWTSSCSTGLPSIPHTRVSSLDELLEQSDVVSLHCPLSEKTRNMIGAQQFKIMKKSAVFLNTARGGLVDEASLIEALESREIAGAALDVFVKEPATASYYEKLFSLENVVVLPHAGGGTEKVQIDSCTRAVRTAEKYLKGEGVYGSNIVV